MKQRFSVFKDGKLVAEGEKEAMVAAKRLLRVEDMTEMKTKPVEVSIIEDDDGEID